MKTILVTGGAGYIGSHTVHYLVKQGFDPNHIIVFDNLVYGHREYLPEGVVFVHGDLLDKQAIFDCFSSYSIDGVIHFAAYAYVGESMQYPGKYFENNILGGVHLLEAMQAHGCKYLVFSSTCATYGIPKKIPIAEDDPKRPINPYGESKRMFETILEWYERIHGIHSVSLRYFNAGGAAYGIGEHHVPETHLIPLAIRAILDKEYVLSVYGDDYDTHDGSCIRDYIHVCDLADAHVKALFYLTRTQTSNVFNLGTGKGVSVFEILHILENISGKKVKYRVEERRKGDPPVLVAENTKAREVLGWKPQHGILDILQSAYSWHASLFF